MNKKYLLLSALILNLIYGCANKKNDAIIRLEGKTMGTFYNIAYTHEFGKNLQNGIDSVLLLVNQSLSTYIPNSTISKINQANLGAPTDAYFNIVYNASFEVCQSSNGKYDHTIMPLVNAWGFGFKKNGEVPDSNSIENLKKLVDYRKVSLRNDSCIKLLPQIMLDFSAVAKGFGVDEVGRYLALNGVENFMVEIGGEILTKGEKPDKTAWKIAIEQPIDGNLNSKATPSWLLGLNKHALATSGNYRNFYVHNGKKYAHEIDPQTGYPVNHNLLSVSVIAPSCMLADAYATAFMVMGMEESLILAEKNTDLEALFIYADNNGEMQTRMTQGFEKLILP